MNEQIEGLAGRRAELDAEVADFMARITNIPCDATPVGKDEDENPERRRVGEPRDVAAEGVEPKAHWDLGVETGLMDLDRGAELSGARFPVLSGAGAPRVREEAGSAGRDTRGIIRQHQFTKVEMVKFAKPEESDDELESMVAEADPAGDCQPRDHVRHGPAAQVRG